MSIRGISLKQSLEDKGVADTRPFVKQYHKFASECQARNPLMRPRIGLYLRAVEANNFKPLG